MMGGDPAFPLGNLTARERQQWLQIREEIIANASAERLAELHQAADQTRERILELRMDQQGSKPV
jgi:hypothetical protein